MATLPRWTIPALLLLCSGAALGQAKTIIQCTDKNGQRAFQDHPCNSASDTPLFQGKLPPAPEQDHGGGSYAGRVGATPRSEAPPSTTAQPAFRLRHSRREALRS